MFCDSVVFHMQKIVVRVNGWMAWIAGWLDIVDVRDISSQPLRLGFDAARPSNLIEAYWNAVRIYAPVMAWLLAAELASSSTVICRFIIPLGYSCFNVHGMMGLSVAYNLLARSLLAH